MFYLTCFVLFLLGNYVANSSGFDYPDIMPDPFAAQNEVFGVLIPPILEHETPIAIRMTSILDVTGWNCVAYYHKFALDGLTLQRPLIDIPNNILNRYGNTETRMLCFGYSFAMVSNWLMPETHEPLLNLLQSWGLDSSSGIINEEIEYCGIENPYNCLDRIAEKYNYEPHIIASIIALQSIDYLKNDG